MATITDAKGRTFSSFAELEKQVLVDAEATLVWARERASSTDVRVRVGGRHELHNDIDREEASGAVCDWLDQRGGVEPARAGRVSSGRT